MVGDVAGLAKRLDQVGRRLPVVFDDENPHGVTVTEKMLGITIVSRQADPGGGKRPACRGQTAPDYAGL